MRVAVVGSGISGIMSAYTLAKEGVDVVLYEKEGSIGGHAKTVTVNGIELDIGFMTFNRVTYPNLVEFFEDIGVEMERSDMTFSVSLEEGQEYEWGTRGLSSLFAQKKNILNPSFWKMIRDITKFKNDSAIYLEELENNPDLDRSETLDHFVQSHGYSELFVKACLIPSCVSIWSVSSGVMNFSAYCVLTFLRNHHTMELFDCPQWLTPKGRSQNYVKKITKELEARGCQIRTNSEIFSVLTNDEGCTITTKDGLKEVYDGCIIAAHAPDALKMLGNQVTYDEQKILGSFQYDDCDVILHHDNTLMPKNPSAWSFRNFLTSDKNAYVTYWLNVAQNIGETEVPYFLSLNPPRTPASILLKWSTRHMIPSVAASKASSEINLIQGKRGLWFSGAYQGFGFHEDGLKAGILAANSLLKKESFIKSNPKHMVLSWSETGARLLVTRFFQGFISTGCLTLLEEGGTIFNFEGTSGESSLKVYLRIHTPQFYWKVATEGGLGLADAYNNGDFSFVDKKQGLSNLFMLFEVNTELSTSAAKYDDKREWYRPFFFTSAMATTKYGLKHTSKKNTVAQALKVKETGLENEKFLAVGDIIKHCFLHI